MKVVWVWDEEKNRVSLIRRSQQKLTKLLTIGLDCLALAKIWVTRPN